MQIYIVIALKECLTVTQKWKHPALVDDFSWEANGEWYWDAEPTQQNCLV